MLSVGVCGIYKHTHQTRYKIVAVTILFLFSSHASVTSNFETRSKIFSQPCYLLTLNKAHGLSLEAFIYHLQRYL